MHNYVLTEFSITMTSLPHFGFSPVLAHSLQANYALSVLNLRDCSIDAEGTSPLAEMCGQLSNLTVVDFSFNGFDHKGIKVLGRLD